MTGEQIKKIILDWEAKFPVDEWIVDDIHIWPMVRNKLYIYLLNQNSSSSEFSMAYNQLENKKQKKGGISITIGKLERFLKALRSLPFFFISLKSKKIIFFGSYFHRTKHTEGYFNRFFDSMIDFHNLHDQVYTIEFQKVYEENFNQQAIIPLHKYLDQYKLLKKAVLFFRNQRADVNLTDYEAFYSCLILDFPAARNLNLQKKAVENWAKKIKNTTGFFKKIFKKVNPEKIIFLSYNGFDDLAAALFAAHKLNFKTIDFQHGPQTNVHMAYSNWTKLPGNSFNTMPSEYWCWDRKTKENIDCWAGAHDEISSKVAGHPYLGFWANKIPKNRNNESYILYSLQLMDLEEMFPKNLVSVIKNSKQKWVFRLHPRSGLGKNEIKEILDFHKIEPGKFSIEDSYSVPLPQTILQAMVHITNFSGCVIESSMMSVPSIIIDEYGKEIYKSYLDDQSVFFINKKEADFENNFFELLDNLKKRTSNDVNQKIINPLTF